MKSYESSANANEIHASEWFNYLENLNGMRLKAERNGHVLQIVNEYNRWASQNRRITSQEIYSRSKKLKNKRSMAINDSLLNEIIKLAVKNTTVLFYKSF